MLDKDREFEFTAHDFERIRKLIYDHAGIALSPVKQDMVYSRLARRLRARGDKTFAAYLGRLEGGDQAEWETFVNSLTTNLTSFFREAHHFDILAEHVKKIAERRPITIWSCAASTGEEAYSIAMTMVDAFNSFTPPVVIIASDLDTDVLAQAREGCYEAERVDKLSRDRIARFFVKAGEAGDRRLRVRPELQKLIVFRRINLLDNNWPIRGPLDAIFCRNVMIYFDKATQYRVLQKFVPLLREDGLLFAGHSESLLHAADLFRPRGRTVYERAHCHG
jgi:chemotaxis protein methyltransferase CheR